MSGRVRRKVQATRPSCPVGVLSGHNLQLADPAHFDAFIKAAILIAQHVQTGHAGALPRAPAGSAGPDFRPAKRRSSQAPAAVAPGGDGVNEKSEPGSGALSQTVAAIDRRAAAMDRPTDRRKIRKLGVPNEAAL